MKIISYIIVIVILINLLMQSGLIFRYYYPLLLEYFYNKKTSWNTNYDRIIAAGFTICLFMSVFFTRELLKISEGFYLIILYLIILIFSTFIIFSIQKMGFSERTKSSSTSTKEATLKYFKNSLNESKKKYLFQKFKKHGIVDDNYLEKDFISKFLVEQIIINMEGTSLYYLHREISTIITEKITLTDFVTFFKDNKNNNYILNSVKQAVKKEDHKLVMVFKEIFECFPK